MESCGDKVKRQCEHFRVMNRTAHLAQELRWGHISKTAFLRRLKYVNQEFKANLGYTKGEYLKRLSNIYNISKMGGAILIKRIMVY